MNFRTILLLALFPAAAWSQSYTFTAIAGQGPQNGSADGTRSQAHFFYPQGTAVDQSGNVYVADTNNHLIRKISPAGVVTTLAGVPGERGTEDGPARSARFSGPQAIAVDASGNVFVASDDHTIRKITPAGVVSTVAGTAGKSGRVDATGNAASFNSPMGLVADPSGNLYIADTGNHSIRKITPAGVVTTYAGHSTAIGVTDGQAAFALFYRPLAIAIDASGNLYVSSRTLGGGSLYVIRKITSAGIVSTLPGSGGGSSVEIRGIAIDSGGNLFISASNYCVRRLTPFGQNTVFVGREGERGDQDGIGASARFRDPCGICIDGEGTLYLAGGLAPVIRKIDSSGAVITLAGQATVAGSVDGKGLAARFSGPAAITGDSMGNLFVADVKNNSIRQISAGGDVTTWVGSPSTLGDARNLPPTVPETWRGPTLAIDSSGNLIAVASPPNGASVRLLAISPTKVVTTIGATGPTGLAIDGPAGVAQFSSDISGIAADGSGNLFIGEGRAVRKIARDGTVSTLAGSVTASIGFTDGPGATARFFGATGIAVDRAGNVFVSDTGNTIIRKITPNGVVSTLAGLAQQGGNADGTGAQARFFSPAGLTVDTEGNVFVADFDNGAIRKISPAGVVTTLTGSAPFVVYYSEGTGTRARFMAPTGIWVSPQGELYITDSEANVVVKGVLDRVPTITTPPQSANALLDGRATFSVTAAGGGLSYQWKLNGTAIAGATDSTYTITAATAASAGSYTVDIRNSAGSITSPVAGLAVVAATMPAISAPPESASVFIGKAAVFSVTASGGGLAYQWKFNGDSIAGATNATYTIAGVSPSDAGNYTVEISNPVGAITSASAALVVTTPGRLINLSVLTALASANDSFTVGLTAGGAGASSPKPLLLRAMGPSLAALGVPNTVPGTVLAVYNGAAKTSENNGWRGDAGIAAASTRVGAFAFASPTSADSAIYLGDAAGPGRTFTISGTGPGVVLAEVYDATTAATYTLATPRLINLSVLKTLAGGLTAGFGIGGNTSLKVLIRAVGPTLSNYSVSGVVARPRLEVFDAGGSSLATNAGWGGAPAISTAFTLSGAFPLDPSSADAVLLLDLSPGNYTVRATAADGAPGQALVEIYEVP